MIKCTFDKAANKAVCQGVGVPICPIQPKGAAKVAQPANCIPFGADRPSGICADGRRSKSCSGSTSTGGGGIDGTGYDTQA